MLGEPALVASHHRRDPQRVALLAQQGVAAISGAVAPDGPLLGEVDDVFDVVAWPGDVLDAGRQGHADGVQRGHEVRLEFLHGLHHLGAHPCHDLHGNRDIGRVRDLDPELRVRGVHVPHAEGDDIHGPSHHAAVVQLGHDGLHLLGVHPVVGGAGIVLVHRTDECGVLDAGDVVRIGARIDGAWLLARIQPDDRTGLDEPFYKTLVFLIGAVEEVNRAGPGQRGDLLHPGGDAREVRDSPCDRNGGGQSVLGQVRHGTPCRRHFDGRPGGGWVLQWESCPVHSAEPNARSSRCGLFP